MRRLEKSRRQGLSKFKAYRNKWEERLVEGIGTSLAGASVSLAKLDAEYNDQHREADGLALRRRGWTRGELRAMHLAYGFLRGVPYRMIERIAYSKPQWERVRQLIQQHYDKAEHLGVILQRFAVWQDAGGPWVQPPPKKLYPRPSNWVQDPNSGDWHAPAPAQLS